MKALKVLTLTINHTAIHTAIHTEETANAFVRAFLLDRGACTAYAYTDRPAVLYYAYDGTHVLVENANYDGFDVYDFDVIDGMKELCGRGSAESIHGLVSQGWTLESRPYDLVMFDYGYHNGAGA